MTGSANPLPISCDVYVERMGLRSVSVALLDDRERLRRQRYLRAEDAERFTLAAVVLRTVVAGRLGCSPREVVVDRTCLYCGGPHGRPRVMGSSLGVSVSHSGSFVSVAIAPGHVGVDVEAVRPIDYYPLLADVCAPEERPFVCESEDFFSFWTRKEALLKATGLGLEVPMTEVVVTPPNVAAAVISYRGAPMPATMTSFSSAPDYAAAVAVLTSDAVTFNLHLATL